MRSHRIVAVACVLGVVTGMACGGGDSGSGPPPGPAPTVSSIAPTTVVPGDTLVITGSHFSTTVTENTVTFSNPVSGTTPFWATATQMRVLVDRDATDGPVTVATPNGSDKSGDALKVTRGVGDVFVFGGTGTTTLLLPNPSPTTRYLVIPHSVNSSAPYTNNYPYKIQTSSVTPVALQAAAVTSAAAEGHMEANQWFEAQRWEQAEQLIERYHLPSATKRVPAQATSAPAATRQFYVLKTVNASQDAASSYKRVTAQLRYTGTKCLVYSDIDTLATGNLNQTDFDLFGTRFDNSIEPTNVSYFGPYSDVDGNGRLIMLVTPVVNRLEENCTKGHCQCGFIAGFFNPRDLYDTPPVPAGTTNHAEIIYLMASDPTGVWDCSFDHDFIRDENLSTIPHEHQHLTSFSWRIFHEGGTPQITWLEEGMAHMAEDLNGDNSSNEKRGGLYRADPDSMSVEDNRAPLEQRGAIYLMLRLLADRYGTGILKNIVQSKCTGRACLENVTGQKFNDLLADFLAAQYLSGTGITSDERFNYQSININDFGPLKIGLNHLPGPVVNGSVRRSTGSFHTFAGVAGQNTQFTFTDVTTQANLRSVIVRIQ